MPRYAYDLPLVIDRATRYSLTVELGEQALHEHMLRESLAYFAVHMLDMDVAEHHLEWSEAAALNRRLAIQAPRDHGKSAFWSYAYPLWIAWKTPGALVYLLSAQSTNAEELLDIIKHGHSGNPSEDDEEQTGGGARGLKGLLDHPKLGHLVDPAHWNKREIKLQNGSTIRARGYGSRMRGGHPHAIVCDDVLDEKSMYSELQREKTKTYFSSAITNMVLKGGQIVVVGTPFHKEDLYSYLAANKSYKYMMFKALIEDASAPLSPDGSGHRWRALWPGRHSVADLLAKKEEIGSVNFAREIMCEPITDDLTLFPSSLFVGDVMAHYVPCPLKLEQIRELGWAVYIGVDLALSANVAADFMRIVVLAQDRFMNKFVLDVFGGRGVKYKQQKDMLIDVCTRYDPEAVYVEANAYQAIFGQEMIEETDIPIVKYVTTSKKHTFDQGVPILRRMLENGKLRFARGNAKAIARTDTVIAELQCFGFVGGKLQGVGSHDDCVMALWLAALAARKGAEFKFSVAAPPTADKPKPLPPAAETVLLEADEDFAEEPATGGFRF